MLRKNEKGAVGKKSEVEKEKNNDHQR